MKTPADTVSGDSQAAPSVSAFAGLFGRSRVMLELYREIERAARGTSNVFIRGETGTGKELVAHGIHSLGTRRRQRFFVVDCSRLGSVLADSELFGHEKGAFTGADKTKVGLVELANRGTLFLDEIGELDLGVQGKLLRFIQEHEFYRVGGVKPIRSDARLLLATHRNIEAMVRDGLFREDLFYRINVLTIRVPPLRSRDGDVRLLAEALLPKCANKAGISASMISGEAMAALCAYSWLGNVRELENVLEAAVARCVGTMVQLSDLPVPVRPPSLFSPEDDHSQSEADLAEARRKARIEAAIHVDKLFALLALERSNGNITKAAKKLHMARRNFQTFLRKCGAELVRKSVGGRLATEQQGERTEEGAKQCLT